MQVLGDSTFPAPRTRAPTRCRRAGDQLALAAMVTGPRRCVLVARRAAPRRVHAWRRGLARGVASGAVVIHVSLRVVGTHALRRHSPAGYRLPRALLLLRHADPLLEATVPAPAAHPSLIRSVEPHRPWCLIGGRLRQTALGMPWRGAGAPPQSVCSALERQCRRRQERPMWRLAIVAPTLHKSRPGVWSQIEAVLEEELRSVGRGLRSSRRVRARRIPPSR